MDRIKIILEDCRNAYENPNKAFRVKEMLGTTTYIIGDFLSQDTINDLISMHHWSVKIIACKE